MSPDFRPFSTPAHWRLRLVGRITSPTGSRDVDGSRADLHLAHRHALDLGELPSGIYFLELIAYGEDNFWTLDDAAGELYQLTVP